MRINRGFKSPVNYDRSESPTFQSNKIKLAMNLEPKYEGSKQTSAELGPMFRNNHRGKISGYAGYNRLKLMTPIKHRRFEEATEGYSGRLPNIYARQESIRSIVNMDYQNPHKSEATPEISYEVSVPTPKNPRPHRQFSSLIELDRNPRQNSSSIMEMAQGQQA